MRKEIRTRLKKRKIQKATVSKEVTMKESTKSFWKTTSKWGLVGIALFLGVQCTLALAAAFPLVTLYVGAAAIGLYVASRTRYAIEAIEEKSQRELVTDVS